MSFPPARPFRPPLQACRPGVLLPAQGTGNHRCPLVFAHAPDAPPGAQTRAIQPPPSVPHLTPHAPRTHQRLEPCPMEPHRSQWAGRFRTQRVHIEHTLPTCYRDFHVPATTGQRQDRLGGEHRGRQRGTDQPPACHKEARRLRGAFCMALPACVPGTLGVLRVPALGVHPAPHCMLAACRAALHHQGAQRVPVRSFQGGAPRQRRSRSVTQYHPEGMESYDARCALRDRRTHALPMGLASVCHGDLPRSHGAMLERFAGVDSADQHLDTLQGQQVHRAREAMGCAWGSWGLHPAGVKDHKASPRRQRAHRGQRKHPP